MLTAHTGNWEWLPVINQYLDAEVIGAYKPLSNPYLDKYIRKKRARYGYQLYPDRYIYRKMMTKSDSSRVFMAMADQRPQGHQQSIEVNFLGRKTHFTSGYAEMAKRLNMPVAYGELCRASKGDYTFNILWIEDHLDDPKMLTEKYAQSLELTILSDPSCWLWSHDRWKNVKGNE